MIGAKAQDTMKWIGEIGIRVCVGQGGVEGRR